MNDEYQETHKNSKIIQNYKFFLDEIQKEQPKILDAIYMTMNKLEIANISLDPKNDNPQVIFESINSTGKSLDDMDLIRNFLLMDKEPTNQEELYKNYIAKLEDTLGDENNLSKFIEAYLRVYYGLQVKRKRIYEIFKQLFREEFQNDTQKALQDLLKYAKIYQVITNNKKALFNDPYDNPKQKDALCDKFGMLQTLQFGVALPFVMRLCNDFQNEVLDFTNFNNMLNILVAHNVRRSICKLESNALANTLYELYDRLKKTDGINATSLAKYLAKKSGKESFPSNTMLEKDFINVNAYSLKKVISFILYQIELSTNKECVESSELTIEHFYPQSPTKQWQADLSEDEIKQLEEYKHTFGNLTLSAINSTLSNKPMQEKIQILKENGSLHLNKYFLDKTSWGLDDIKTRSQALYEKFIDIEIFKDLPQEYRKIDSTLITLESDLTQIKENRLKSLKFPNGEQKGIKTFKELAENVIAYLRNSYEEALYEFIESEKPKCVISSYDTKKKRQIHLLIDDNYAFATNDILRDIKGLIEGCECECSNFEITLK